MIVSHFCQFVNISFSRAPACLLYPSVGIIPRTFPVSLRSRSAGMIRRYTHLTILTPGPAPSPLPQLASPKDDVIATGRFALTAPPPAADYLPSCPPPLP